MRAPRVIYALILALFGLLLSACQNEHRPALRIATNPWPGYEFLHLAQMLGYYEEYGVQVKLLELASLNDARVSFERGQADGFTGTLIEVLMARQFSSRQPRIVLVTDYSNGGDVLIAKTSIADLNGLRGLRVGVEPGTLNLYLLQRALETQGMKLSDVQLVGMNQEAMGPAMAADELDAAVTYPPFSVSMLEGASNHTLFTSREIPEEVLDVLVFDQSTIEQRADDIRAVLNAYAKAQDFARRQPDKAYQMMAARQHISAAEFARIVKEDIRLIDSHEQANFFPPSDKLLRSLERTQAVLRTSGDLDSSAPVQELIEGLAP